MSGGKQRLTAISKTMRFFDKRWKRKEVKQDYLEIVDAIYNDGIPNIRPETRKEE